MWVRIRDAIKFNRDTHAHSGVDQDTDAFFFFFKLTLDDAWQQDCAVSELKL